MRAAWMYCMINLIKEHVCNNCGTVHKVIPAMAKPQLDGNREIIGWHWQCACNSTMFKLIDAIQQDKEEHELYCSKCDIV